MSRSIRLIKGSPSLFLLVSLITLMLAAPQAQVTMFGQALLNLLFALVLLAAIHSTTGLGWHRGLAVCLAVIWLVLRLLGNTTQSLPLELASTVFLIAFGAHTVAVSLRRVVTAERVDFEILCSLPSIYLLLALTWAVSFEAIEILSPGSFQGLRDGATLGLIEFFYFSLTTMTTLGFGDITPVGPTTRIWVILEAVTGVFFMAVLVARLVTLYRS
jgi:hypothetical protein